MNYRTGYTGNWGQQMETKEHAITDLLEQWAELEPERFTLLGDPVDVLADVYAKIDGVEWNLSSKDYGPDRYVIQGAVQEAIQARGWTYWLISQGEGHAYARIYDEYETGSHVQSTNLANRSGSSPVYALLSAFVNALREVKEDE